MTKRDQWGCLLWDESHPASSVKHHPFLRDNAAKPQIHNQHHKPWIIFPPKYVVVLLNLSCGACCMGTWPIGCSFWAPFGLLYTMLSHAESSMVGTALWSCLQKSTEMICLRLDFCLCRDGTCEERAEGRRLSAESSLGRDIRDF